MTDTTKTMTETMEDLAETIRKVPQEKQGEVNAFMAGYLAGLEHRLGKQGEVNAFMAGYLAGLEHMLGKQEER